jgi:GH35 family endo-1,4-beta-xylanase
MLLSPWIENPLGRHMDERLLDDIDRRIESVRKNSFEIVFQDADGNPITNCNIEYRQIRHDFIFGCNIFGFDSFGSDEKNELYKERFRNLFNLAVLPFYWRTFEPNRGEFPTADRLNDLLAWCEQNDITPKGHPLAWRNPAGYPEWLPGDDELVADLLKGRIQGAIENYGDRIRMWDVVNEPTHLPPFGCDNAFDYVFNALQWAHEKDPGALLTVNDYGILGHDFGHGPFGRLLDKLVAADAPLGCIGFQAHEPRSDWIPAVEIYASLDAYSRFDLPIHITEITVSSSRELPITNSWKKGVWSEREQADYLESFYKVCFSHPSVEGIIYWDLCDSVSWVRNGGLTRPNLEPKPAYERLSKLINEEWLTEGSGTTDKNGMLEFAGFYGTYEIRIPSLGESFQIQAHKGGDRNFHINTAVRKFDPETVFPGLETGPAG